MQPTIVCVDDEETVLVTIKEQLKFHLKNEYLIEVAESGEEALELLEELAEEQTEIPVFISDQIMPGLKGDELLQQVHSILPRTLKILLTGQASAAEVGNAVNLARLYRYIGKPWDEVDLVLTVKEAIRSYFRDKDLEAKNIELESLNRSLCIRDERHDRAVKAGGVGVWEWNPETNAMYLGTNLKALLGYEDHEIRNHMDYWARHLHPDDMNPMTTALNAYLSGEADRYEFEHRMLHKDGSVRWFIVRGTAIRDDKGRLVRMLGTSTDITARKVLEENWRKYEFIVNAAGEFMTLIDRDYVYTAANKAYCEAHDTSLSEIIGKSVADIWGQETFEKLIRGYLEKCFSGREVNYEAWFAFPGKAQQFYSVTYYPYFKPKREVTHAAVISHDITDRRKMEDKLRDSRQRLRAIFDSVQAGIVIIEATRHVIVETNVAATEIMGIPREKLIGSCCFQHLCKKHAGTCPITDLGQIIENAESEITRSDGKHIPIQRTVIPIMLDDQEHLLESFTDISRLKKAEEKKQALEQQLRQSQKIQAIGTLAGGIAHDFNNILTPIMVNTEVSLLDIPNESPVRRQMEAVLDAGKRARDLVKQILVFSRHGEQERKPLQISVIVKEAIKLIKASLPAIIEIHEHVRADSGLVLADPTQIHQVLMNLCTNAAHAMREKGGTLKITLSGVYLDAESAIHFPGLTPGNYVEMRVRDTGGGMKPSVMERIFDPYFSTKPKEEGTGLGLSVVQGIVTSHGGAIRVNSAPGKGTIFQILFPEIRNRQPAENGEASQLPKGDETVLLIDDEKSTVDAIQLMLERLGYEVIAKTDAAEGLKVFQEAPFRFDLIITDQAMPKMLGSELAERLLQIRPDIPIILCTGGYNEQITEDKTRDMGIRGFIMKPIIMDDIAQVIRRVLGKDGG